MNEVGMYVPGVAAILGAVFTLLFARRLRANARKASEAAASRHPAE